MPVFSPVDLDIGSLEVLNDPFMYAQARARPTQVASQGKQNHLTLQYHF